MPQCWQYMIISLLWIISAMATLQGMNRFSIFHSDAFLSLGIILTWMLFGSNLGIIQHWQFVLSLLVQVDNTTNIWAAILNFDMRGWLSEVKNSKSVPHNVAIEKTTHENGYLFTPKY